MIRLRIEDIPPKFIAYIVVKAGLQEEDLQLIPGQYQHTITGFYAKRIGKHMINHVTCAMLHMPCYILHNLITTVLSR